MSRIGRSIAVGNYDRVRPLVDNEIAIDGVDPTFMLLEPEEIFFRAFRHATIHVRRDGIDRPETLCGKRVGVPE